jgi:hypothetical protein
MQGMGRLAVDPGVAREAAESAVGQLSERLAGLAGSAPTLNAGRYGAGLADRAAHLVELVDKAHQVRMAHTRRLLEGVEVASTTVGSIEGTDEVSRGALSSSGWEMSGRTER